MKDKRLCFYVAYDINNNILGSRHKKFFTSIGHIKTSNIAKITHRVIEYIIYTELNDLVINEYNTEVLGFKNQ